jgi:hypothetical protein
MADIGKVRAVFTASTSGLVSGVNQAVGSMSKMEAAVGSLRSGMTALVAIQGAQLFASVAGAVSRGVSSMVSYGQAQAEVIDQQSKLAARLGMTLGEFSGLALAGDLAGVSMETIAKAATKADIMFVKASQGSKVAQAAFAGLGLSVDQLGGLSASERFDAIAAAIAKLPTEAQRAAAAVQVFGKSGVDLLPLFSQGAEGIAQAREQAERLGLTLTNAQGQDVEAMNDAFTMAGKAIEGVVNQVVAYLSPAVKEVADTFTNLVGSVGGANIGQAIGDGILRGARFLAGIGDWLIANLSGVWEYVSQIGGQWGTVVEYFNRAAGFFSGVFNAAEAGLGFVILGFGKVIEGLAWVAQQIGKYLGFDTKSLDAFVAGAAAFNAEIIKGIDQNLAESAAGFERAFGESTAPVGAAIAGPLTTALDASIARAQESAAQVDTASRATPKAAAPAAELRNDQALKGIDSRSQEGISEMFRLMRGGTEDVQEKQLSVLEQIRDGLGGGDDEYPFALEGG